MVALIGAGTGACPYVVPVIMVSMGTFRVPIEVGDPQGQRFETVQALVDAGAWNYLTQRLNTSSACLFDCQEVSPDST